ncbi:MAG TPA: winged helix-turn-helix transcriptional regulator [Candidatus Binatia bacterium]|nr:winged helix-turn-helix transcriptional regulator [Candidatus Binatia bacterium]
MMNQNEQIETVTFQALAHQIRRTIIRIIQSKSQGTSYTELITELGMSTGKLNYHLEQLKGLIEKNSNQRYVLTPFGKKAAEQLDLIEQKNSPEIEKYVKIAALSQKTSLQPIVKAFLTLSIALSAVLTAIWVFLAYFFLTKGGPLVVLALMPVLIAIGFGLLGSLVCALVKAPSWVKRFEQRFFGEK